jgi:ribonuclease P protein component
MSHGGWGCYAVALSTLKKRAEFLRVRGGPRWSTPAFVLEARPRPAAAAPDSGPRFGFTVSKKVGGAVVRNRVRRRLRALVAALDPGHVRQDFDYVLIARPGAVERGYRELEADLGQALDRVHRPRARERRSQ